MDYKNEMRKLIDIVKQQSFEATLADTMDDLLTLTTATKDLSDRINTRVAKSLNANDNDAIKYKPNAKSKAKKVKNFPSITPPTIPKSLTRKQIDVASERRYGKAAECIRRERDAIWW